jgi:hypothetical protein
LPASGARRARHQPGLGDVGVHHVEEVFRLLVDDLGHLVLAGCDHQDVDAAETLHRGLDDGVAIGLRARPLGDDLDLAAERLAFGGDLLQRSAPLAQITTLAPAPASTLAAIAPNAPESRR